MLWIIDLAFEQPVRSVGNLAEAMSVICAGAANNIAELMVQNVAEEVAGSCPKLIQFAGAAATVVVIANRLSETD